jgi:hypothetical protein
VSKETGQIKKFLLKQMNEYAYYYDVAKLVGFSTSMSIDRVPF